MVRSRFGILSLLLGASIALAACSGPPSGASASASGGAGAQAASQGGTSASGGLTKLVVPYQVISISNLPVFTARDAGIFTKHGLDVELTYVDNVEVESLISGSGQIAQGGGPEVVSANASGADVVFIATLSPVYSTVLEAKESIKTPADLKGMRIGPARAGSLTDVALRHALRDMGLEPDRDVTIVPFASPQGRTPALLNGQIDATLDSPPNSYREESQGFHVIYNLAEKKLPTISNGVTVRRDWLNANKPVAQAYIDALMEGIGKMKTDKPFAAQVLKNYMKLSSDEDAAKAADWTATYLTPSVPMTHVANFSDMLSTLGAENPKIATLDISKFIDNSLVQSAVDRGLAHRD